MQQCVRKSSDPLASTPVKLGLVGCPPTAHGAGIVTSSFPPSQVQKTKVGKASGGQGTAEVKKGHQDGDLREDARQIRIPDKEWIISGHLYESSDKDMCHPA